MMIIYVVGERVLKNDDNLSGFFNTLSPTT